MGVDEESIKCDVEKIQNILDGVNMVFIIAHPKELMNNRVLRIISEVTIRKNIITVAIVPKSLSYEKHLMDIIDIDIQNLEKMMDSVVVIKVDESLHPDNIVKNLSGEEIVNYTCSVLKKCVKGILVLTMRTGLISLDFEDITAILKKSGLTLFSFAESVGENRATCAVEQLIKSPLLEKSIFGAGKILINVAGDDSIELDEARSIADIITSASGKGPEEILFGLTIDEDLGDKLEVYLYANGFDS